MAKNKLSAWKAREMIKNPPHGKKLSPKQNAYFHLVAEGKNKYEGGGWLEKYSQSVGEMPLDREQALSTIESLGKVASAPQKGIVKAITGKYQTPAEAMNIHNPIGSFAVDTILDPTNLFGAGIGKNMLKRVAKTFIEPDEMSTAIRLAEYVAPKPELENGGYLGYDTTGRNYSPAWGGQFYNGGEVMNVANLQNPIAQDGATVNDYTAQPSSTKVVIPKSVPFNQEEYDYYHPQVEKGITSGDWKQDLLYKNQWLANTPIIGKIIKDKAYDIASRSRGAERISNVSKLEKKVDFSYTGADDLYNPGLSLVDQYFYRNQFLPKSKYVPKSDYLTFLPTYSIKSNFEEEKPDNRNRKIKDIIANELNPNIDPLYSMSNDERADVNKRYSEFTTSKSPIYNRRSNRSAAERFLGLNLAAHKTGLAYDKSIDLPYASISDAWDFEPNLYTNRWGSPFGGYDKKEDEKARQLSKIQSSLMHKVGYPFKIYDRLYFNPETKEYISDDSIQSLKRSKGITPMEDEAANKDYSKYFHENGGNIPGSVENMYARIGAPSNGPYAKKTQPSAQDGTTVYYQNGLDWNKVRGMQDGGEVNPYNQFREYNPFPVEAPKSKEDYGVYGIIDSPMKAYQFEQSYWKAQENTPEKEQIQLIDTRNVPATQRFNPKVGKETVSNLVQGAKERGLNPATVLSMALAESNMSRVNPLHSGVRDMNSYDTMKYYAEKYPQGISAKTISDESLDLLKEKMEYARKLGKTNEADVIQSWNGYGTIPADRPMYGIKGPIDMSKNPVYGKRILDLRENVIKKNPELLKLLEDRSLASLEQGGSVQMKNQLVNLDQLTNFSNYNKPTKNWLNKYK